MSYLLQLCLCVHFNYVYVSISSDFEHPPFEIISSAAAEREAPVSTRIVVSYKFSRIQ